MNRTLLKAKLYTTTLLKYYFTREPRLTWTIVLSVVVYFWMANIQGVILENPVFSAQRTGMMKLGEDGLGLVVLFVKPIFVYIAGLIVIGRIKKQEKTN